MDHAVQRTVGSARSKRLQRLRGAACLDDNQGGVLDAVVAGNNLVLEIVALAPGPNQLNEHTGKTRFKAYFN